eukprot:7391329-Prymnesium_polylepis.1
MGPKGPKHSTVRTKQLTAASHTASRRPGSRSRRRSPARTRAPGGRESGVSLDSGERKAWTAACRAAAARSQRTERTRAGAGRAAAHHIECERRRKFGAARVTVNNLPLNRKASWCHGISLWRQQFFAC